MYLLGEPTENLGGRMLPTPIEVLRVYFHRHKEEKQSQKDAVKNVFKQLWYIWAKARIPTSEQRNVRKLEELVDQYRNLCGSMRRGGDTQLAKEVEFVGSINLLFDIAQHNSLDVIQIEEDKLFLMDQRADRKYVTGGVDKELAKKEDRKEMRRQIEAKRRLKQEQKYEAAQGTVTMELSFSSEDTYPNPAAEGACMDIDTPSTYAYTTKRKRVSASEVVSPGIASALDRTRTSDRKAPFLLSSAAKYFGDFNRFGLKFPKKNTPCRHQSAFEKTRYSL